MSQNFIDIIQSRGFVHQMTDENGLRKLLSEGPQTAYIGFDCTAPSLHVGSLLQIMLLRWWQKCGNKPIVLLGGGTTKIGDPSGKDESRPALTDEKIAENMGGIKKVFEKFIDFNHAEMVDNDTWLSKLNYVQFLREIAPHFTINRMMTMDSVKLRLDREQPLSLLEFNYMVLQAYDFAELNRTHDCRVQMGGSDQWGNIVNGVELNRRLGQKEIFGITSPLITTSNGAKMGKTAAGAVWLNADLTSPYDYWQFWRNTDDRDVERFLKLFTELSLDDISSAVSGNINDAKKLLATEATAMLHGRAEADKAAATAAATFGGAGVSENLPKVPLNGTEKTIVELLVATGLATSNGEARKLIQGKGVKIEGITIESDAAKLLHKNEIWYLIPTREVIAVPSAAMNRAHIELGRDSFVKLSKGKKQHILITSS